MDNPIKPTTTFAALGGLALSLSCAHATLLVHEPFDYPSGVLLGNGGALGTTGVWNSSANQVPNDLTVYPQGSPSGVVLSGSNASTDPLGPNPFDGTVSNLATSGSFVGYAQGGDRYSGDIALDSTVTSTFQTGATTWISYVSVRAWDRNEEQPNLVLGTDPAPNNSRGDDYGGIGTGGSGFGTGGGPTRNNRTDIYPMFYTTGQYNNVTGAIAGNSYGDSAHEVPDADGFAWQELNADGTFGAPNIIVVKLEWNTGAGGNDIMSLGRFLEGDVISEANFDALIAGTPSLSTANWDLARQPSIDETQLDTITVMGIKYFMDEIRIGTTFADVTPIPEPSALALLGLGLAGLLGYRRRA